ncbi:YqaA family protein [Chloroflexota bacterium]
MDKIDSDDKKDGVERKSRLKNFFPLFMLLLVIAISVGSFLLRDKVSEVAGYGYLGAFLISLTFNATVILPAGNFLVLLAFGAFLPSATMVGVAGGSGAAIGEITGYMVGYSGRGIAKKSKLYSRVEGWVRRWGVVAIFIFALVPFFFDLAGIAAGVLRFPFWKFLLVCWLGRTILYVGVALAGSWGWETLLPILINVVS